MTRNVLKSMVPLIIVIVIWQTVSISVHALRGVTFPSPWHTFVKLFLLLGGQNLADHTLYQHISSSLGRWLTGFGIAASLGVTYGLVAGRSRAFENATSQIPHLLLLIPGLAWIPVAILMFGIGELSTIFMIAITAVAPIAINVLAGIKRVDIALVRAARMMGAGKKTLFFQVLVPGALPEIISGLRIGLGSGWRVLVAAEMVVGTGTGLGYSIIQSRWTMDYTSSFACIIVICAIGLFFEQVIFKPLERRTIERWALKGDME